MAPHRQSNEDVAGLPDEPAESTPLGADDDHERNVDRELIGKRRSPRVEADDPVASSLQIAERARQVGHPRDPEVLDRSSRGLFHRRRHSNRAMQRNHDPIRPDRVGASKQRAEVLRIFERVEGQEQRQSGSLPSGLDQIFQGLVAVLGHLGDDALVIRSAAQSVERPTIKPLKPNAALGAQSNDLRDETGRLNSLGDQHTIDRAPGSQRFQYRVPTPDERHGLRRRLASGPPGRAACTVLDDDPQLLEAAANAIGHLVLLRAPKLLSDRDEQIDERLRCEILFRLLESQP